MYLSAGPDIPEKRKISFSYRQTKANMPIAASFLGKGNKGFEKLHE